MKLVYKRWLEEYNNYQQDKLYNQRGEKNEKIINIERFKKMAWNV